MDAAFDAVGGAGTAECVRATKRGGTVVGYGFVGTTVNGKPSTWLTLRGLASLFVGARLSGRRGTFYGITLRYRRDKASLKEDLPKLFALLASRKIKPVIAHRLPLLAVRRSQELLEAGGLNGKIVLLREVGLSWSYRRGAMSPVIVISGAVGALGTALSRHLVVRGYSVAGVGLRRHEERLRALERELGAAFAGFALEEDCDCWVGRGLGVWSRASARSPWRRGAGGWRGGRPFHGTATRHLEHAGPGASSRRGEHFERPASNS